MFCEYCKFENNCEIKQVAPDVTGCNGHSKMKDVVEIQCSYSPVAEGLPDKKPTARIYTRLSDLSIGDRVKACNTTGTRTPGYLEGQPMTIVGFTKKGWVKCDLGDGGKLFSIHPSNLVKI